MLQPRSSIKLKGNGVDRSTITGAGSLFQRNSSRAAIPYCRAMPDTDAVQNAPARTIPVSTVAQPSPVMPGPDLIFGIHDPRRIPDYSCASRHVSCHDRAGADDSALADRAFGQQDRPGPDHCASTDFDIARNDHAGTERDEVAASDMVADASAAIDQNEFAEDPARAERTARIDIEPLSMCEFPRQYSGRIDDGERLAKA
jgi:hypothetical protein